MFAPPVGAPFGVMPLPVGPPGVAPAPYADLELASTMSSLREEEDYTFWRYSRFKLPFLILILGIYVMLIGLTVWQSESDIRYLKTGLPRDLTIPENLRPENERNREAGIPLYKRDLRYSITVISIFFVLLAFLIFVLPLKPAARTGANYVVAFFLFAVAILATINFAFDVNSERNAYECTSNPNYTQVCESKEDVATVLTVFDAILAVACYLAAFLLAKYSRSGDWTRAHDPKLLAYGEPGWLQPGMYPNGVSFVRKWLVSIALLSVLAAAIVLLIVTIMVTEYGERVILRDIYNRPVDGDLLTMPGWPQENTTMRYILCGAVIILVVINLIPLWSRVIAYLFGFLYFVLSIYSFVQFAVDVSDVNRAQKLDCPVNLHCVFHRYNATVALDFIGAFFLLVYVVFEYCVAHRRLRPGAPPPVPAY